MNRVLLTLLLINTQSIFCGGIFSSLFQGQTEQEQEVTHNYESSQDVSFACDPNNGTSEFSIKYNETLNGVVSNSSFSWTDPEATDNCNAIERRLACETDPAKQKALNVALKFQRVLRRLQ